MSTNPAVRSLAVETRAVEEGHHAIAQPDGSYRVVSDSTPGKWYAVYPVALEVGGLVQFTCYPEGVGAYVDDHQQCTANPGLCGCKHVARVAQRLEREGIAAWVSGRWVATDDAIVAKPRPVPSDPFAGLVA